MPALVWTSNPRTGVLIAEPANRKYVVMPDHLYRLGKVYTQWNASCLEIPGGAPLWYKRCVQTRE